MELGPKTKIDDLLSRYPFLLEFFLEQSPKYRLLKNPVTRRTVGKVATMSQVASIGGLELDGLLDAVAARIRSETGEEVTASPSAGEVEALSADEREARLEVLKDIIRDLHEGEDMAVLKQRFQELIKDVGPTEISAMEQALIDEGMPESEVKRLCDVHVEVFKSSLEEQAAPEAPPGHPVHTFMLENRAAEQILGEVNHALGRVPSRGDGLLDTNRNDLERLMEQLAAGIDLHYLRKENQLFPILEEHGVKGPSQVMWALHDDIRSALKTARSELASPDGRDALNTIGYAVRSIEDMIYKEEHILFPMALETLTDADWQRVRAGEDEIGYAWVEPEEGWSGGEAPAPAAEAAATAPTGTLRLSTGELTPGQVDLVLTHLPVELTFVDENDEVRYYTQVEHKIFPRSPGVIGRRVQNCHPPASLDKVQKILDQFRAGEKDVADFWIEREGRFIYIRYFAVRDAGGVYRGTLEAVQDVTGIRALTGQKRLLDRD